MLRKMFQTAVPEPSLSPSPQGRGQLPWWTWVIALPLFHLGTLASLQYQTATGTSAWYWPVALAAPLVLWWGPRVLLALWLNATICASLWGLERWWLWPLYALPETCEVGLIWLLFQQFARGRTCLPNLSHAMRFTLLGLIVPVLLGNTWLHLQLLALGDLGSEQFWTACSTGIMSDALGLLAVSVPLMMFLTPWLERRGWTRNNASPAIRVVPDGRTPGGILLEVGGIGIAILVCSLLLPFASYWFAFGFGVLWIAVRCGIGATLLISSWTVITTWLVQHDLPWNGDAIRQHLGLAVLCLSALITGRAITSLRDEVAARQALNQELERRVRERTAELESFSYTVSHDLRAPLRAIDGFSQAVIEQERERLGPDGLRLLERIRAAGQRMNGLIEGLIAIARIGRVHLVPAQIDLSVMAEAQLAELHEAEPARSVRTSVEPGLVVRADPALLRALLQNLLGNAWKYTRRTVDAEIMVRRCALGGKPGIEIADNGAGFDMAYAERLFKPFQRLHTDHDFEGTGIGLASVQRIVERHGGTIAAEAEVGKGARFSFTLGG